MASTKTYKITPLKFNSELIADVMRRRTNGESISTISTALKVSAGKIAMAELVGSTERITHEDSGKLARAVVKDRKAGKAWGWLAARYGITEGCARRAYEAGAGEPSSSLDFRRKAAA